MKRSIVLTLVLPLIAASACTTGGSARDRDTDDGGPTGPGTSAPIAQRALALQIQGSWTQAVTNIVVVVVPALVVTNTANSDFVVETGIYPWRIVLYSDAARTHEVWRMDDMPHDQPDRGAVIRLAAGETRTYGASYFPQLRASALPTAAGRYYAAVELEIADGFGSRSAPLPAGELVIGAP